MAMLISLARTAIVLLSLLAGSGLAAADDLSDFNAAVEKAESHNRVAIGYLRTGNRNRSPARLVGRLAAALRWRQAEDL
jgi:hypothetical protein